ncbi:MAG: ubiquitin-like protein Pup [Brachybacterium sp.]|nr:ubiquitin-like protein Pup [Brachybacterium sp.]
MSQSQITPAGGGDDEDHDAEESTTGGQTYASLSGSEDLLDEIDSVLEENAETFVRSFVQKGGQ